MYQKSYQSGRSLLETLAVLAVIAILTISGALGYNFVVRKYREKATVKQINELAVRYKAHPIKQNDNGTVDVKPVFPEAERASAVEIKTPDSEVSRVSLSVQSVDTFAVVVNQITDGSCREALENGAYEHVLWNASGESYNKDGRYISLGKDFLKNWDNFNKTISSLSEKEQEKYEDLKKTSGEYYTKEEIISTLCADRGAGRIGTAALIWGDECPRTGSSYWYGGQCHNCAYGDAEDSIGACCEPGQIDACGYCQGCPSGFCHEGKKVCVECLTSDDCKDPAKPECDPDANICKECVTPGATCTTKVSGVEVTGRCTSRYTCEPCDETTTIEGTAETLFRWDPRTEICSCRRALTLGQNCLILEGVDCCKASENVFCKEISGGNYCTKCTGDYSAGTDLDCPNTTPLCEAETAVASGKGRVCKECPAADSFGSSCTNRGGCSCRADLGLTCDSASGTCKCPTGEEWLEGHCCVRSSVNPLKCKKDCPADGADMGCNCDDELGEWLAPSGWTKLPDGHCCPAGQKWLLDAIDLVQKCCIPSTVDSTKCKKDCPADGADKGCTCDDTTGQWVAPSGFTKLADGHCCPSGQEWLENQCCVASSDDPTRCACPPDRPYPLDGQCWECTQDSHCASRISTDAKTACSENHVCTCPAGTFWNPTVNRCTACLVNKGAGTGECPTDESPICNTTSWTCEPCPTGLIWNGTSCVECTTDAHCAGRTDGKTLCDTTQFVCVPPCLDSTSDGHPLLHNVSPVVVSVTPGSDWGCTGYAINQTDSLVAFTGYTCAGERKGCCWADRTTPNRQRCCGPNLWPDPENNCSECVYHSQCGGGYHCDDGAGCNGGQWCRNGHCCPDGTSWNGSSCVPPNPYNPGQIVYESSNTCCARGACACCGGTCAKNESVKLYPGYYEVIVIGAGGGGSGDANGHHSTNYGMGGTGGSGGSFKGTLRITSVENVSVATGKGGSAVNGGGTGGTGGSSSISGLVSCPGGGGAYSGGKHSHSAGAGAGKCSVSNASKFSSIEINAGGKCGSSTYCKHTKCSTSIGGSSPAIKVTNNYGGSCCGVVAFKSSKRSTPSGNCGYVKITYKGAL